MRVSLLLAAGLIISVNDARASPIIETVNPAVPTDFATVGAAAKAEVPGNTYTINVAPGNYLNDFAEFKAATVVNGTGVTDSTTMAPTNLKGVYTTIFPLTVNGVSFIGTPYLSDTSLGSGISLANGANSSAIRVQSNGASTIALNNVTIENFQMGMLTGSDSGTVYQDVITISNSNFINNGFPTQPADPGAFGHALYVGDAASLTVTGSLFCGQQVGHDIKSRAAATTVTGSTMFVGTNTGAPAGCNVGSTSLAVDLPNGGVGEIANNLIVQGTSNQNGNLIDFGEEGLVFTQNSLDVSNNTLDGVPGSFGIVEFHGCPAPVTGLTTNTVNGVSTLVSPATCTSTGSPGPGPVAAVPEPASLTLLGSALLGLGGVWLGCRRRG